MPPDAAGAVAIFGSTGAGATVDLAATNRTVGTVEFWAAVPTTIQSSGGAVVLDNSGSAAVVSAAASGSHQITAPVQLAAAGANVSVAGVADVLSLTGGLTGSGGLTKTGAGTLTLQARQTYAGETVVDGGTLVLAPPLPSMQPADVAPGSQYRLMFVSDGTMFVRANANGGAGRTSAVTNTGTSGSGGQPISNMGGQLIAANNQTLWSTAPGQVLANPVRDTQFGVQSTAPRVATGMTTNDGMSGYSLVTPDGGYVYAGDYLSTGATGGNANVLGSGNWASQLGPGDANGYRYERNSIYVISVAITAVATANALPTTTVLRVGTGGTVDLAGTSQQVAASGTTIKAPSVTVNGCTVSAGTLAVNAASGIATLTINSGTVAAGAAVVVGPGGLVDLPDSSRVTLGAPGDTNLDGLVDLVDLLEILGSGTLGTGTPAVWGQGDFHYDGITDLLELLAILGSGTYDQGNSSLPPRSLQAPSRPCPSRARRRCWPSPRSRGSPCSGAADGIDRAGRRAPYTDAVAFRRRSPPPSLLPESPRDATPRRRPAGRARPAAHLRPRHLVSGEHRVGLGDHHDGSPLAVVVLRHLLRQLEHELRRCAEQHELLWRLPRDGPRRPRREAEP